MKENISGPEILFIIVLIFGLIIFVLRLDEEDFPDPKVMWERFMQELRKRAALVICSGAAIMLIDALVFSRGSCGSYLVDLSNSHYLTLIGGFAALVGVYHWITASVTPPE